MKIMLRYTMLMAICAILLTVGGCGYQVGSIMHPQFKTVAIAEVKNDTLEPLAAGFLRQSLCEQFQLDGSMKVVNKTKADCIVYANIIEVKNTATSEDSHDGEMTYRAAEWGLSVTAELVVVVPGRAKPLVPQREVSATATYQNPADQYIARRNGLKQACRDLAEKLVVYTTEAW